MSKKKETNINHDSIPKQIELFGRTIKTVDDSAELGYNKHLGEARYGANEVAVATNIMGNKINPEEIKLTYLHEILHFILSFTGYQEIIKNDTKIDLEQFIELLASGIYQYEKSAKY
jgi:hypothetical protein